MMNARIFHVFLISIAIAANASSESSLSDKCKDDILSDDSVPQVGRDHISFAQLRARTIEQAKKRHGDNETEGGRKIKVRAYYVNMIRSHDRASCMEKQLSDAQTDLADLGIAMDFQHWPAVVFEECQTLQQCMKEKPECFPNGASGHLMDDSENSAENMRATSGNWCSRLKILHKIEKETASADYFMIFDDDTILTNKFSSSLRNLFDKVEPLWTLTAFDTFSISSDANLDGDDMFDTGLPLASISGKKEQYWGSQAWLLSASRLQTFAEWYRSLPTMPLDMLQKAPSPLHQGMLSYKPHAAIPRRFFDNEISTLPEACREEGSSGPATTLLKGTKPDNVRQSEMMAVNDMPREVIILGMYDTGTNLMHNLIEENLEKPNNVELCRNYSGWAYCGAVWKHTHPARLSEFPQKYGSYRPAGSASFQQSVAVVMVRHPFSLMRSLQDESYDMDCPTSNSTNWLRGSCSYVAPTGRKLVNQQGNPRLDRPTCNKGESEGPCWSSVVEAWNSYNAAYLHQIQSLFHKVIIVRYEDIIENPFPALNQIALTSGVAMPPQVQQIDTAAKQVHGTESNGHDQAMQKLNAVDYAAHYSDQERSDLCSQVNKQILFQLGYHGCQEVDNSLTQVEFEVGTND